MRAYRLHRSAPIESSPLALSEVTTPAAGQGEILIRVQVCGLCHTDLHIAEGELDLPKLPLTPGHQVVGRVASLGPGAEGFALGDRVGVPWLYSACGRCDYCERGLENLCDDAKFTGWHVDGGYAEFMVAPADFIYSIPEGFSDEQAAPLLCGGVIGYRAFRLANTRPGATLGLYGFGSSAHMVIQVALARGCRVHVFTRGAGHRRMAADFGAAFVGRAEEAAHGSLDAAIVFAPAGALVPQALRALRKGGTLALAGIYMSAIPEMSYELLYGEREVRTVANSTRRDVRELLILAAEIPIRTRVEQFAFEDLNHALAQLKSGNIDGGGVLQVAAV